MVWWLRGNFPFTLCKKGFQIQIQTTWREAEVGLEWSMKHYQSDLTDFFYALNHCWCTRSVSCFASTLFNLLPFWGSYILPSTSKLFACFSVDHVWPPYGVCAEVGGLSSIPVPSHNAPRIVFPDPRCPRILAHSKAAIEAELLAAFVWSHCDLAQASQVSHHESLSEV